MDGTHERGTDGDSDFQDVRVERPEGGAEAGNPPQHFGGYQEDRTRAIII
jgi:hypothetical protein